MANHSVGMCTDWHGMPGDQVTFVNSHATETATVTQWGTTTWPFTADPGFKIPPAGFTTNLKSNLPNAVYYYDVDKCSKKSVTIP